MNPIPEVDFDHHIVLLTALEGIFCQDFGSFPLSFHNRRNTWYRPAPISGFVISMDIILLL
jgi:hypothetical protein